MTEHDDKGGAESLGCELDAADLRRGDDVAGNAYDEQIAQTLIEDDLGRDPRIGAAENDGEWRLAGRQLVSSRLAGEHVHAADARDEALVAFPEPIECLSSRNHRGDNR